MVYCFDADLPIEEVYRLLMKEEEKDKNRIVICYCGCGETYRYGDEINFRKTNLKHLIFQRDKMTKENEELKDYIDEYEKEKQRKIDCGEYDSNDSLGLSDDYCNLHSNEDKLKEIDRHLNYLNSK